MNENVIVSFDPGTSGRFVCSIVWNLINGFNYDYPFTERNSAHLFGPWIESIEFSGQEIFNPNTVNDKDVYSIVNFTNKNVREYNPYINGLLQTHVYPDFETIEERLPNTKIILITYDESDILEIALNIIYKNLFDTVLVDGWLNGFISSNSQLTDKVRNMAELYNNTGKFPDSQYMKKICIDFCLWYKENTVTKTKFLTSKAFRPDTLVIKYSDLFLQYGDQFPTLNKISIFLQKEITPNTIITYKKYIDNRNNFLKPKEHELKELEFLINVGDKCITGTWPNLYSYKSSYTFNSFDISYVNHNYINDIWPAVFADFHSPTLVLGNNNGNTPTFSTMWPAINLHNQSHIFSVGQLAEHYKHMFKYIDVTIWPNAYSYDSIYSTSRLNDREINYNYNYQFHTMDNIWPNILSHNVNVNHYLGTEPYTNYNYEFHTFNNIWPNILTHYSNPGHYLGTTEFSAYNPTGKGTEYIICSTIIGFKNLLIPTIWSIENSLDISFDMLNQISPWRYSINIFDMIGYEQDDVYDRFEFTYTSYKRFNLNQAGLLDTKKYPDFEVIFNRYPEAKLILIELEEDDKLELATNIVYQKWLTTDLNSLHPFDRLQIKSTYKEFYGKDIESLVGLEKKYVDLLIEKCYNSMEKKSYFKSYTNPILPEEYKDRVLVLKHKDFYTKTDDSYVGLYKLSKFINKPITESVFERYKSSVEQRNIFIENCLPNYED